MGKNSFGMQQSDQPNETSSFLGQRFPSKLAISACVGVIAGLLFNRPFSLPAIATTTFSYLLMGTLFFSSQECSRNLRHNEDSPLNSTFAGLLTGGVLSKLHPRRPSSAAVGFTFAALATGMHLAYDSDTGVAIRQHFDSNEERDLFLSTFKVLGMRRMTVEELAKYKERRLSLRQGEDGSSNST